jgi:chemotaxis protein MotB
MSRNPWASANDYEAIGVSGHPGRGWRIFAVLVTIGAVSFIAAYYVPLFRAHQRLSGEYAQLSQAATGDRQKLATTVKALENVSTERDTLRTSQQGASQDKKSRAERLERLARELEGKLQSKKQARVERHEDIVEVTFASSTLNADGDGLSDAGKKLLCQIAETGKVFAPLRYELRGLAKAGADSWQTAAGRAGSAAETLPGNCRVDARNVLALASGEDQAKSGAGALLLKIDGKSGTAGGALAASP